MATTIRTISGREIDLEKPTPEMIDLRDIAHALGHINRFTGHTREPYSVARHCVIGSRHVPGEYALEFLLHDAAEAYLGDVSGPLKSIIGPEYKRLELLFEQAIAERFGLDTDFCHYDEVKQVDAAMLAVEFVVVRDAHANRFAPGDAFEQPLEKRIACDLVKFATPDPAGAYIFRANQLMAERYLAEAYQPCAK